MTGRLIGLALAALLWATAPLSAQTYLTTTTNSAAFGVNDNSFAVASASGISAGGALYINHEFMRVTGVSGTTITVQRGQSGTRQTAHGASQTVIIFPAAALASAVTDSDPTAPDGFGTCTPANHQYLPIVNVRNGNVWLCRFVAAGGVRVWAATNTVPVTYNSLLMNLD